MIKRLKAILSLVLAAALGFCLLPIPTAAAEGQGWYVVNSSSPKGYCYLYSAASDRDGISTNKGRYDNGELVYVLDYSGGRDGKYSYCRVQTQDGKTGYMHDYALTRYYAAGRAQGDAGWYMVQSVSPKGYCYLYSAASDRDALSRNLGRYDNGTLVYVLDYHGGQDGKYNYCRVQTRDGQTGYMHDYALLSVDGIDGIGDAWYGDDVDAIQGDLSSLPVLTVQGWGTVTGGSSSVYTGPSTGYYRSGKGNAYAPNGAALRVYGREGNWSLVQFTDPSGTQPVSRFAFLPADRVKTADYVRTLEYAWLPIRISTDRRVADAPDTGSRFDAISIDGSNAYALAKIVDPKGSTWIYFESIGLASSPLQSGWVSVRGFVPVGDVSLR